MLDDTDCWGTPALTSPGRRRSQVLYQTIELTTVSRSLCADRLTRFFISGLRSVQRVMTDVVRMSQYIF